MYSTGTPPSTGRLDDLVALDLPHVRIVRTLQHERRPLDALGVEAKLSPAVFKAIHESGVALWDDSKFLDWAASQGLDRKKVQEVFTSFAIDGKMKRAMQLAQQYQIQAVPTVIVDGKFVTSSDRVGTHANLPAAIDELVAKARAERKG